MGTPISTLTPVPHRYQVGEVYFHMSEDDAQNHLEKTKGQLQEELTLLKTSAEEIESVMVQLKVKLYAKFGNNINLEED